MVVRDAYLSRVRIAFELLLTFFFLVPPPARAIQLRWSAGTTDLAVAENTRAVLLVQADSVGMSLPAQWRFLWTADSSGIQFSALDSATACLTDTALVSAIDAPSTPADTAAHQLTAHFCSAGSATASTAAFLVDLVGGSRGKLQVVALDPEDSTRVLESGEVTFNGGIPESFGPYVLTASQSRSSTSVSVTAVGGGLSSIENATIVATDASWTVPLVPITSTESILIASAEVPASLPPATLELTTESGSKLTAPLTGDEVLSPTGDYSYGHWTSPIPNARPKDFAFFYDGLHQFHLFFITHYQGANADTNERRIGHVRGGGLRDDWSAPDIASFTSAQGHSWDAKHVWAPSVIQRGNTYYMFYCGVDNSDNQTIGVASTTNINASSIVWSRPSEPIVIPGCGSAWADQVTPTQCRDPFVTEDPSSPGTFVMLYTTQLASNGRPAIGIARNSTSRLDTLWEDAGRLEIVDVIPELYGSGTDGKAESPHWFAHVNVDGDTSYYVLATGIDGAVPAHDRLLRNRRSPWDHSTSTAADHWNLSSSLYDELGFDSLDPVVFGGWEASETCRLYGNDYVAGVNATNGTDSTYAVWIVMLKWLAGTGGAPDQMALMNPVTDVRPGAHPLSPGRNELRLAGSNPGGGHTRLEVSLSVGESAELSILDIQGRKLRILASGQHSKGGQFVTWDQRDESGRPVPCGVYLAHLRWRGGQKSVRVVVIQ